MLLSVETQHEVPPKWSRPPQPSRALLDVHIGQNYFPNPQVSPLSCLSSPAPDLAWAIIRPGGLTWPFPALTDVRVFVLYKRARAQLPLSVRHQPPFSTDMWATLFSWQHSYFDNHNHTAPSTWHSKTWRQHHRLDNQDPDPPPSSPPSEAL